MGLLAPLYALAALAVAAPILFHLIRRQPRGQTEFSSLMFLDASPPRLTRRSRLDNLFLLLLRAAALALIALAFARPFMRSVQLADLQDASREIILMIDTSGSMQRLDVWQAAIKSAQEYIDGLGEADRVALATFDSRMKVQVPLPELGSSVTPREQQQAVASELKRLAASYRSTQLSQCLMAAVELLQDAKGSRETNDDRLREIVLVSDFHENSGLEALQGYAWPENIRLDIRRVSSLKSGNARADVMQSLAASESAESSPATSASSNDLRVRIENNKSSEQVEFDLHWLNAIGKPETAQAVHVQVPPGQVRVVPVPISTTNAQQLQLTGDNGTHDNVVNVPRTSPRVERVGYIGQVRDKPEEDLFFFLSQVPLSTPERTVTIERLTTDQLATAAVDESLACLVIEWPFAAAPTKSIEDFIRAGKPIIAVMARPVTDDAASLQPSLKSLSELLGLTPVVTVREAERTNFALWTDIDFRHPLFQPLADAKYNDFGKVRFWAHRKLELPASIELDAADIRIVAKFDDQSPAVLHRRMGHGDLWVLTAGWQATGSQLALSTKFVPLMFGMLDPRGRSMQLDAIFEVDEAIPVTQGSATRVTDMDDKEVTTMAAADGLAIDKPGLYWFIEDDKKRQIAVTLPQSESHLDPLDLERFQQYGVVTGKSDSAKDRRTAARLSQVQELEGRQKLWRWVLVGAIVLLLVETVVATRNSLAT